MHVQIFLHIHMRMHMHLHIHRHICVYKFMFMYMYTDKKLFFYMSISGSSLLLPSSHYRQSFLRSKVWAHTQTKLREVVPCQQVQSGGPHPSQIYLRLKGHIVFIGIAKCDLEPLGKLDMKMHFTYIYIMYICSYTDLYTHCISEETVAKFGP